MAFTAVPDVLAQMVFDQFERALRRAVAVRVWGQEGGTNASEAVDALTAGANAEHVALGFVDLVGSTAWAQGLSLRDQSLALARFESAAWSSAVLCGGRIVKMIGDEVFFAAPPADAACRIGIDVIRAAAEDEVLPPARGVVGLGYATPREGDYFGPLVNLLSRMVKLGQPGQLVVTDAAAVQLSTDDWKLRALELADLRGVPGPVKALVVDPT
jgi:adenylate cyclase